MSLAKSCFSALTGPIMANVALAIVLKMTLSQPNFEPIAC
jgi:hypothetical protein